jgi:hypothetical protein
MSMRAVAFNVKGTATTVRAGTGPLSSNTTLCSHGRVVVVVTDVELLLPPPQAGMTRTRTRPTASLWVFMLTPLFE